MNIFAWWRSASELRSENRQLKSELRRARLEVERLSQTESQVRTLMARVMRRNEEIESLQRQRDTALETLERLQWRARMATAAAMSQVKQFGMEHSNGADHNIR